MSALKCLPPGLIKAHSIDKIKKEQGERNALFQLIRQQGVMREIPLMVATIRALAEGEFRIKAGTVTNDRSIPIPGYDLSMEIEEIIAKGKIQWRN